jgi:hypothetical protein
MMLVNRNDRSNKIKRSKDYEIVSWSILQSISLLKCQIIFVLL